MIEHDQHETPMVFRKDRKRDPEITAVFPCEPADIAGHYMTCYVHVGQHGACGWQWYHGTRTAQPEEYASLLAELISLGYKPKIYKRIQPWMRESFDKAVAALKARA